MLKTSFWYSTSFISTLTSSQVWKLCPHARHFLNRSTHNPLIVATVATFSLLHLGHIVLNLFCFGLYLSSGFIATGLILLRSLDLLLQPLFPAQARAVFKLPDWVKFAWFLVVGSILLRRPDFLLQALFYASSRISYSWPYFVAPAGFLATGLISCSSSSCVQAPGLG